MTLKAKFFSYIDRVYFILAPRRYFRRDAGDIILHYFHPGHILLLESVDSF